MKPGTCLNSRTAARTSHQKSSPHALTEIPLTPAPTSHQLSVHRPEDLQRALILSKESKSKARIQQFPGAHSVFLVNVFYDSKVRGLQSWRMDSKSFRGPCRVRVFWDM